MGNNSSIPSQTCRFFDLPAEMRNEIYFLTLKHDRQTGSKATPALLRTCKQIYAEAIQVLHAQSMLSIKIDHWYSSFLKDRKIVVRMVYIIYYGTSWQSAFCYSLGLCKPLPADTMRIRNLHLYFAHSPYFENRICMNAGRSSETVTTK
ncbi:uncharacterized protein CLAFUR5_09174 [Fulvia fulva]|uniref:Uncharacterized protein n=1 Tax=Passalora fulva TaxID=5499 RepID=A0A9Q8UTL5_PASFU|nr:uncharacterized protein CLAFUR5_09174 [Fulvia fulva]UJO22001.1 hypothetical protein CLAFUR5_09174 [Fulvia fulva]